MPFQSRRVPLSTFFDTLRLFPFFGTVRLFKFLNFLHNFFIAAKAYHQFFDVLQQNGCSKMPKRSHLLHFLALCDLPETSKKISRKIRNFVLSLFSFLRAFVVSSCRKSGFRVLLSLQYSADLTWAFTGLFFMLLLGPNGPSRVEKDLKPNL